VYGQFGLIRFYHLKGLAKVIDRIENNIKNTVSRKAGRLPGEKKIVKGTWR